MEENFSLLRIFSIKIFFLIKTDSSPVLTLEYQKYSHSLIKNLSQIQNFPRSCYLHLKVVLQHFASTKKKTTEENPWKVDLPLTFSVIDFIRQSLKKVSSGLAKIQENPLNYYKLFPFFFHWFSFIWHFHWKC